MPPRYLCMCRPRPTAMLRRFMRQRLPHNVSTHSNNIKFSLSSASLAFTSLHRPLSAPNSRKMSSISGASSTPLQQPPPPPPAAPSTTTRRPTGPVPFLEFPSPHSTTPTTTTGPKPKRHLLFFTTGNPGLISYYTPFLTHLRTLLNDLELTSFSSLPGSGQQPLTFHIYGQNLLGFSDADHSPFVPGRAETEPFVLEEQVAYLYESLCRVVKEKGGYDEILLAGHSVGGFLSLEVLRRSLLAVPGGKLPISAAVLLFPTIHQMHLSPSGLHLSRIRAVPVLDRWAHVLAKQVVDLVPGFALRWILRRVLGMSEQGSEVTVGFLRSRDGIWQALHLGKDEMEVIRDGEGRWGWWATPSSSTSPDDEVVAKEMETVESDWECVDSQIRQEHHQHHQSQHGSGQEGQKQLKKSKFFLYFGQNDHWVADKYRDEFIESRKKQGHTSKEGGTKIVIDQDKIPHAFCINHSEQVAEKVRLWVEEVLEG